MREARSVLVCCLVLLLGTVTGCGYKTSSDDEAAVILLAVNGFLRVVYCAAADICPEPKKSAVASEGEVLVLSATAHVSGVLGTDWRSDVELHNLSDTTASLTIRLLIHRNSNASSPYTNLSISPGESVRLEDVLESEFGRDGLAALLVSVQSGRVVATSRTFNLLAGGNPLGLPGGSTFGQYIPALPAAQAVQSGEEGRLIQLSHSTAADGGFRTNLGIVNATAANLEVKIGLFRAGGELLGSVPVSLGAHGYRQLNQIYALVTSGDVADGYAVVTPTAPDAAFFAYASVVDNLTGDPIAISAIPVPESEPLGVGDPAWVVAAAHVAGAAGTNWRTDLEVHCWGDAPASYDIELLKHGADNADPVSASFILHPGESERFVDVLFREFGFEGAAALRIRPTEGHVLVTSRTYNLIGTGDPTGLPEGATFGQYIPGIGVEQAIPHGEEGRLIQLSHKPGETDGFRTNLALVNATHDDIDVEIDLYRSDGALLGTRTRNLGPLEYRQINRVFETVTSTEVSDGYVVVRTTTENGAVFALASVVDNLTGDPVGLGAVRAHSAVADVAIGQLETTFDVLGQTTVENTVNGIQMIGVEGVLDRLVKTWPESVSSSTSGIVIDFGDGTTMDDGSVWSGSAAVDTSSLSTGGNSIAGTVVITVDDLETNEVPVGSSTAWTIDLEERSDGTVVGEVSAEPAGGNSSTGSLSGTIVIDTAICEKYPIAGSLTFISGGRVTTIVPSPECDGSLEPDVQVVPPGYDFVFTADDPWNPSSNAFITSVSNAEVSREGDIGGYWRPMVGAETFAATTPGVITFHHGFDRSIAGGELLLSLATFHFSYSQGHAFLYGSTDGVAWQQLSELGPPPEGTGHGGGWNGPIPPLFIGATDIWLQVRLYSYGPQAFRGGIYCNTVQMFRFDPRHNRNTFELMVDLEDD